MHKFIYFLHKQINIFEESTSMKLKNSFINERLLHRDKIDSHENHINKYKCINALWKFISNVNSYFNRRLIKNDGIVYTPRKISEYMSSIVDINKSQILKYKVIDPAIGGGVLILAYLQRVNKYITPKELKEVVSHNIYGLDILPENVIATKVMLSIYLEINNIANTPKLNVYKVDSLKIKNLMCNLKNKFDVVLSNPPYVKASRLSTSIKYCIKTFWSNIVFGLPDLYIPFFGIALWLVKYQGQVIFITPNTFLNSMNGKKLRKFLIQRTNSIRLLNFDDNKLFGNKIMTYSVITKLYKGNKQCIITYNNGNEKCHIHYENYTDTWRFLNKNDLTIINKLESTFTKLKKLEFKNGIATQRNSIYAFHPTNISKEYYFRGDYKIEKGITRPFVLPNRKRNKKLRIIFPYKPEPNNKHHYKLINEEYFKRIYPKAYMYLLSNKRSLDERKSDSSIWFAYGRSQGLNMYGDRLYLPYMGFKIHTPISTCKDELFAAGYAIFSNDLSFLKSLQNILESNVFTYYLIKVSKPYSSGYYSTSKRMIENFSVPTNITESGLGIGQIKNLYDLSDSEIKYINSVVKNKSAK